MSESLLFHKTFTTLRAMNGLCLHGAGAAPQSGSNRSKRINNISICFSLIWEGMASQTYHTKGLITNRYTFKSVTLDILLKYLII